MSILNLKHIENSKPEALLRKDRDVELWLKTDVVAAYDHYLAHPETTIPLDKAFRDIKSDYLARKNAI